jgi:RND family efflux transporter MFP subunit
LFAQPIIAIAAIIGLVFLFGYAQKNHDWFNNAKSSASTEKVEEDSLFACSMLCVFVKAPGRCPVCGMELQKIESQGDPKDLFGVTIDPTARRLANIKTVVALNMPVANETEVLGRIAYDETAEATVAAYVDGRIEDLLVDFTGATIRKGEELAVIYSPDLYADQVGLIQAKRSANKRSSNQRVNNSNQRLYQSARRRLVELGLPESQVDSIEASGTPNSRIKIYAPATGTVVEKMADKGKYVKTGMPILKIADLSKVWLMLEMYPEDTTNLKLGQSVSVSIQSQVGKTFEGTVSFIDPMVNSKTQTVKVRVVIPNDASLIKIGDFGKAKLQSSRGSIEPLVVVPRESVLMNGANSIAYVETEPGRFEFRKVEVAEIMKDKVSISSGIKPGEQVVASGVFMLDSTFNIQGKVSLIDPNRAAPKNESQLAKDDAEAKEIAESFSGLSPEDRKLAEEQVICPVTEVKLGTLGMGAPIRVKLEKRDVMICCEGCRSGLVENPEKNYAILDAYHSSAPKPEAQGATDLPQMDLPDTELPQMDLPQMDLPQMELPQMEAPK